MAMRERGAIIAAVAAMPEVRRRLRRERMAAWEAESMVMPGLSFSAKDGMSRLRMVRLRGDAVARPVYWRG